MSVAKVSGAATNPAIHGTSQGSPHLRQNSTPVKRGGPKSIETHDDVGEDAGGKNRSISLKRTNEQKEAVPMQKIETAYEDIANPPRGAPGLRVSQTAKSAE